MKKLLKFVFGAAGAAVAGFGAYCAYKKLTGKDEPDDDFDDDIDDFDLDEENDDESPEYVSLNIKGEDAADEVKDALDDANDAVKDAAEDIKDAAEDAFN